MHSFAWNNIQCVSSVSTWSQLSSAGTWCQPVHCHWSLLTTRTLAGTVHWPGPGNMCVSLIIMSQSAINKENDVYLVKILSTKWLWYHQPHCFIVIMWHQVCVWSIICLTSDNECHHTNCLPISEIFLSLNHFHFKFCSVIYSTWNLRQVSRYILVVGQPPQ